MAIGDIVEIEVSVGRWALAELAAASDKHGALFFVKAGTEEQRAAAEMAGFYGTFFCVLGKDTVNYRIPEAT